jgi:hypothetical protein
MARICDRCDRRDDVRLSQPELHYEQRESVDNSGISKVDLCIRCRDQLLKTIRDFIRPLPKEYNHH